MKRIIITGGLGFIGSNLVKYFLKKKYFVINIDKLSYSANKYNLRDIKSSNYKFFKTDINNKKKISKIIKKYKPSIIFNLAAETHVDRSIDSPKEFIESNINGVFNLLESIRSKNKNYKFIKCDLLNKNKLKNIIFKYKPSGIFNLAAETHVDRSIDEPKNFINSNILGVYNLLESISNYKKKIIRI